MISLTKKLVFAKELAEGIKFINVNFPYEEKNSQKIHIVSRLYYCVFISGFPFMAMTSAYWKPP